MRATAEWRPDGDWLKDMSWVAAKEGTAIEAREAKKRVAAWRKEVWKQVLGGTSTAHRWGRAPLLWAPARADHSGSGVAGHAQRLQEDLEAWLEAREKLRVSRSRP